MNKTTFFSAVLLLLCFYAKATVFYVKTNGSDNANGTSWSTAFKTLENAFNNAVVGDQVWVASGVYKPTGSSFNLPNGVKLYGGFAGTEGAVSQRDLSINTTTLNGDIGAIGTSTDNCDIIIKVINSSALTTINGFRFINSYNNSGNLGGAITVTGGSATIENCTFIANYGYEGSAIGFSSSSGVLNVLNCDINNNNGVDGCGIYCNYGTVYVKDTKIQSNISSSDGGAIYSYAAIVVLDRCNISGNSAATAGGAFYAADSATFEIYNSLIVGNYSNNGAVLFMYPISNSKTHKIINCTISGNRNVDTDVNTSDLITLSYSGNCPFYNNILWNNTAPVTLANGVVRRCFVNGTRMVPISSSGVSSSNPQMINIGNPSQAPFTTDSYDYHLSLSSTAINYGLNSYVNSLYNQDLEGYDRIYDGTTDVGCYEVQVLSTDMETKNKFAYFYDKNTRTLSFNEINGINGETITVLDFTGKTVHSAVIKTQNVELNSILPGYYIVTIGKKESFKLLIN